MTQQGYYIGFIWEMLENELITIQEARRIEKRLMKLLGYKWSTYFISEVENNEHRRTIHQ